VQVKIGYWLAAGLAAAFFAGAGPARAATTVTPTVFNDPSSTGTGSCATAASGGECSLREAISFVGAGGMVALRTPPAGVTDTYTLTQGALTLGDPVTIAGADARHTVLTAGGTSPDIVASTTSAVRISGLTITGGASANQGAGISNTGANLTLDRVQVSANRATGTSAAPARGGGVYNAASLTLSHSTVWGNTATAGASPFAYGGGLYNDGGTLVLTDSTIAGNSASGGGAFGGGIAAAGPTGSAALSSVTLSSNSAAGGQGGNLWVSGAAATLRDTIVAAGTAATGSENCAATLGGRLASAGYNLEDRAQCGLTGAGDQSHTDPRLGPLQDNGGSTETQALPASSPAVDQGNPGACSDASGAAVTDDQRGQPRLSPCDIGAFEGSYPPSFAGPPTLSGKAAVGSALACTPGAVAGAPSTLTYLWLRDGEPIPFAIGAAYLVSDADAGHSLRCEVTASNHDASTTSTSSALAIPPDFAGVLPLDSALQLHSAHVRVRLACSASALGRCRGTVSFLVRWSPPRPRPKKPKARSRRARKRRPRAMPRSRAHRTAASKARTLMIGRAGYQIASGRTVVLFVRIPGPGQRMVIDNARRGGLHSRLVTAAVDDGSRHADVTRAVVITTARRKPRVVHARHRKRHTRRRAKHGPRRPARRRK